MRIWKGKKEDEGRLFFNLTEEEEDETENGIGDTTAKTALSPLLLT